MAKDRIRDIEFIAKRYGRLPSELLDISIDDLQFNLFAANIGLAEEAAAAKKQNRAKGFARGKTR